MKTARVTQGVVWWLCGAGMVLGCSGSMETTTPSDSRAGTIEQVGRIGLRLQPVAGITVTGLHYTVTQGAPSVAAPIVSEGNLPTPGTGTSFSLGLPLPVGSGYFVSLSGFSAEPNDDVTCSGVVGPVEVQPNVSTAISLQLTCVDNTNGQALVSVDVETDACPRLIVDYAVAEPALVEVGRSTRVYASAHDLDNPAESIKYTWSIADPAQVFVGAFSPSNARDTSFECRGGGDSVRIRVTAENHECRTSLETAVSCIYDLTYCGDGVVEPDGGETCDWGVGPGHPADPTCPFDCTKVCGDGVAEGDEQCDPYPLDLTLCFPPGDANACKVRNAVFCGDGFVSGAETCDILGNIGRNGQPLPSGQICESNCQVRFVRCGDGLKEANEECDVGGGLDRCCTTTCESLCLPGCLECEQAGDCFFSSDNCLGPSATPFTLAQQKVCTDVMQCVQDSNCLDGASGSLGRCYCGTLGNMACTGAPFDLSQPGAPNGPCAAVMQAGNPGATSNANILGNLTTKSRPAGAAGQRLNCQKADPSCAPICGVQ